MLFASTSKKQIKKQVQKLFLIYNNFCSIRYENIGLYAVDIEWIKWDISKIDLFFSFKPKYTRRKALVHKGKRGQVTILFKIIWQVTFLIVFGRTLNVSSESCENTVYCTTKNITDIMKNKKGEIQCHFNHKKLNTKIYSNVTYIDSYKHVFQTHRNTYKIL